MNTPDDFRELGHGESPFEPRLKRQKTGVIKSVRNHVKGTIQLDPLEVEEQGVEFFQPIYEGELIVGVIHKCSCGKTSELRFQYSE